MSHIEIAKIDGCWLLHLEQRAVGPVMVLELWHQGESRWAHMRDIVGAPSFIGIEWDDAENRPRDPEAARAVLERLIGRRVTPAGEIVEHEDNSEDEREFRDLSEDEQREYMLERAEIIANATPMEDGASWDDPEEWQLEAAELAHAVVAFLAGPQTASEFADQASAEREREEP